MTAVKSLEKTLSDLMNTPFKIARSSSFFQKGINKKNWYLKEITDTGISVSSFSQKKRDELYDKDDQETLANEEEMAWLDSDDLVPIK